MVSDSDLDSLFEGCIILNKELERNGFDHEGEQRIEEEANYYKDNYKSNRQDLFKYLKENNINCLQSESNQAENSITMNELKEFITSIDQDCVIPYDEFCEIAFVNMASENQLIKFIMVIDHFQFFLNKQDLNYHSFNRVMTNIFFSSPFISVLLKYYKLYYCDFSCKFIYYIFHNVARLEWLFENNSEQYIDKLFCIFKNTKSVTYDLCSYLAINCISYNQIHYKFYLKLYKIMIWDDLTQTKNAFESKLKCIKKFFNIPFDGDGFDDIDGSIEIKIDNQPKKQEIKYRVIENSKSINDLPETLVKQIIYLVLDYSKLLTREDNDYYVPEESLFYYTKITIKSLISTSWRIHGVLSKALNNYQWDKESISMIKSEIRYDGKYCIFKEPPKHFIYHKIISSTPLENIYEMFKGLVSLTVDCGLRYSGGNFGIKNLQARHNYFDLTYSTYPPYSLPNLKTLKVDGFTDVNASFSTFDREVETGTYMSVIDFILLQCECNQLTEFIYGARISSLNNFDKIMFSNLLSKYSNQLDYITISVNQKVDIKSKLILELVDKIKKHQNIILKLKHKRLNVFYN